MKHFTITTMFLLCYLSGYGQQDFRSDEMFDVSIRYTHEFLVGGYVKVREWELDGDKLQLRDLGVRSYSAIQAGVTKQLPKGRKLSLTLDYYFLSGKATLDREIAYNGTIIDATRGIDVSPTRYYRVTAAYYGNIFNNARLDVNYLVGLVFDHATFYVDGKVSDASPRNEVYEGFGKQSLPYPFVGIEGTVSLAELTRLKLEASGTYIPEFKSFYNESGSMYLQYATFKSDLVVTHRIKRFNVSGGATFRYLHWFEESVEDTNILRTVSIGPFAGISFRF